MSDFYNDLHIPTVQHIKFMLDLADDWEYTGDHINKQLDAILLPAAKTKAESLVDEGMVRPMPLNTQPLPLSFSYEGAVELVAFVLGQTADAPQVPIVNYNECASMEQAKRFAAFVANSDSSDDRDEPDLGNDWLFSPWIRVLDGTVPPILRGWHYQMRDATSHGSSGVLHVGPELGKYLNTDYRLVYEKGRWYGWDGLERKAYTTTYTEVPRFPIGGGYTAYVKFRDGCVYPCDDIHYGDWDWEHSGRSTDIVAFKLERTAHDSDFA